MIAEKNALHAKIARKSAVEQANSEATEGYEAAFKARLASHEQQLASFVSGQKSAQASLQANIEAFFGNKSAVYTTMMQEVAQLQSALAARDSELAALVQSSSGEATDAAQTAADHANAHVSSSAAKLAALSKSSSEATQAIQAQLQAQQLELQKWHEATSSALTRRADAVGAFGAQQQSAFEAMDAANSSSTAEATQAIEANKQFLLSFQQKQQAQAQQMLGGLMAEMQALMQQQQGLVNGFHNTQQQAINEAVSTLAATMESHVSAAQARQQDFSSKAAAYSAEAQAWSEDYANQHNIEFAGQGVQFGAAVATSTAIDVAVAEFGAVAASSTEAMRQTGEQYAGAVQEQLSTQVGVLSLLIKFQSFFKTATFHFSPLKRSCFC